MIFKMIHTNLNVYDMKRAIDFYEKALDLHVVRRIQPPDGSMELAFLCDADEQYQLELTWLRGHAPYELGDNESHICFRTDDLAAAHERHAAMNCICHENKSMGMYFIEDPDGYWLEIVPVR
jgi:lactoylglutathione lyase